MPHRIALLHPGAMGVALGRSLRAAGHHIGWCSAGRSTHTASRARSSGFESFTDLPTLLEQSDIVLAVCPPDAAAALAAGVAKHRYRGIYVDANAIAPATATAVRRIVGDGGASYVDGGIIGPPPTAPGTTWLHVAGEDAAQVVTLFAGTPITVTNLGADPTAASSLKMCFAAWTKGSSALLLAVAAAARAAGVEAALHEQWRALLPELSGTLAQAASRDAPKAWRFAGEMAEIAATFDSHGLPRGFHDAAAATFAALAAFRDAATPPALDEVLETLLDREQLP